MPKQETSQQELADGDDLDGEYTFTTDIKRADFVSTFARGLDLIRAFSHDTPLLSVSLAAERTGLSRAAARRFLLTLYELGYISMVGDSFALRPKVLELGFRYLSTWPTSELVTPYLREGVKAMNENVSFGVLEGSEVVYVARAEARRLVHSLVISIGSRVPAALSAMGRVLLAHQSDEYIEAIISGGPPGARIGIQSMVPDNLRSILADIREKGWCLVVEEFEKGVMSVAVPIHGKNGKVIAAINVGAPTTRATPEHMVNVFLPALQKVGANISEALTMRDM